MTRAALGCALALLWAVAGCSVDVSGGDGQAAGSGSTTPDAACPVTPPMSPDRYPQALRDQAGRTTWYGDGALWVDLAGLASPARVGDSVRERHEWWTVDSAGAATRDGGPPTVRATRLDGPGHRVATLRGRSDGSLSWWSARLTLPANSCWLLTGEQDDAVVRVVVRAS